MSPKFRSLISRKGAELSHMLLLYSNRKSYMVSLMPLSHLTLSDSERSKSQGHWISKPNISYRTLLRPYVAN